MAERCIQQITGDCGGCPIQDMARDKIYVAQVATGIGEPRLGVEARESIAKAIGAEYCPTGTKMRVPELSHSATW